MKTLDNLQYLAGGYSAEQLTNAKDTERRQISQLGRASLISILASTISWGIASSLFAHTAILSELVLMFVIIFIPVIMFSLNRTLFYHSDMANGGGILLPLFRLAIIVVSTTLCFHALPGVDAYGLVLPFLLAGFELYPLVLKMNMGQSIAGNREQARVEHEHMRGDLKKHEYIQGVEQAKVKMSQQPTSPDEGICPQLITFIAEKCQAQIKQDASGCISCPNYENVRSMR